MRLTTNVITEIPTDPVEGRWTAQGRPLFLESTREPIGFVFEGSVPKDILTALVAVAADDDDAGAVSVETGLDNTPPSTFEGFDGDDWPESYFDAVAAVPSAKAEAIAAWARWARWLVIERLGIVGVFSARSGSGRPFPQAILRKTRNGIAPHVDSAKDEYPGTVMDPGDGAVQWSVITYLTNHHGDEGHLLVYDSRPLENGDNTVSYPLARPGSEVDQVSVKPLKARTVLVRSDHVHEVLPTTSPRKFVTMFVIVAANGTAVSAG